MESNPIGAGDAQLGTSPNGMRALALAALAHLQAPRLTTTDLAASP